MADVNIAVDLAGGDRPAETRVEACQQALKADPKLQLTLVSEHPVLLHNWPAALAKRVQQKPCSGAVDAALRPSAALRSATQSGVAVAIAAHANGDADGVVSAGNTGALMGFASRQLGLVAGLERPALIAAFKHSDRRTWLLDIGANIDTDADLLLQFGLLGSALVEVMDGVARPRVGLLNVGTEPVKGRDSLQQAAALMHESSVNYCGFAEGHDLFSGHFDAIVCDGFTGNAVLKACEGMIRNLSAQTTAPGVWAKLRTMILRTVLQPVSRATETGALMLGLDGVVVKAHGSCGPRAFAAAIATAARAARETLPARIDERLQITELTTGNRL